MALFRAPAFNPVDGVKKILDDAKKQADAKDFAQAKKTYSKAIHYDPSCLEAYLGRAKVFEQLYKGSPDSSFFLDQAIADYSAVLSQNPYQVDALSGRAMLYQKKGAAFKALSDTEMKKALEERKAQKELVSLAMSLFPRDKEDPKLIELSILEGYYFDKAAMEGRRDAIRSHMVRGLEYYSKNFLLRLSLVKYFLLIEAYDDALTHVLQCISDAPSTQIESLLMYCGVIYSKLGCYEQAKKYCINGMSLNKRLNTLPSHLLTACIEAFNAEKQVAQAADEKAVLFEWDDVALKIQSAITDADYQQLVQIGKAFIRKNMKDHRGYIICANAYLHLEEYQAADQYYAVANFLTECNDQNILYCRATTSFILCDPVGGDWYLRRFIQLNENGFDLKIAKQYILPLLRQITQLGVEASVNNDFEKAEKYFEIARDRYPNVLKNFGKDVLPLVGTDIAILRLEYGIVYEQKGDLVSARQEYFLAYLSYPDDNRIDAKAKQFNIRAVLDKLVESSGAKSLNEKRKAGYAIITRPDAKQVIRAAILAVEQKASNQQPVSAPVLPAPSTSHQKKRNKHKHVTPRFTGPNRSHQATQSHQARYSTALTVAEEYALLAKQNSEATEASRLAENKRNAIRRRKMQIAAKAVGAAAAASAVVDALPIDPKPVAAEAPVQPVVEKKENEKRIIVVSDEEKAVLIKLKLTKAQALFVGGAVRQRWLTKKRSNEKDIDVVTTATDEQILSQLKEFGVVKNPHGGFSLRLSDGTKVDIYRSEHLNVSLKQDAAMRDFTMNALYADDEGNVIDGTGTSIEDLMKETLVPLSAAKTFFERDPANILRAYYVSLESGKKLPEAYEAEIKNHLPALAHEADIKASKINYKLMKAFFAGDTPEVFKKLLSDGVIDALFKPAGVLKNDKEWIVNQLSEIFEDSPNVMLKRIYMVLLVSLVMQDPAFNASTVYNMRHDNPLFCLQLSGMNKFAEHYNNMIQSWRAAHSPVQPQPQALPQSFIYYEPPVIWGYMSVMQVPVAPGPQAQFSMWTPPGFVPPQMTAQPSFLASPAKFNLS